MQSALLEAMQERRVTIGNKTYPLPAPFLVIATQNPIEQSGTFELPEAQLDRFMLCHRLDYPSAAEEEEVLRRNLALGLRRDEKGAFRKTAFDLLKNHRSRPSRTRRLRWRRCSRSTSARCSSSTRSSWSGARAGIQRSSSAAARAPASR